MTATSGWETLRHEVRATMRQRGVTHVGLAAAIGRGPASVRVQVSMRKPPSAALQAALRGWVDGNAPAPTPGTRPPFNGSGPHSRMCAPTEKNSVPAGNVSASVTAWEYRVVRLPEHDWEWQGAVLNADGAAGWELVSVYGGVAYFRRVQM